MLCLPSHALSYLFFGSTRLKVLHVPSLVLWLSFLLPEIHLLVICSMRVFLTVNALSFHMKMHCFYFFSGTTIWHDIIFYLHIPMQQPLAICGFWLENIFFLKTMNFKLIKKKAKGLKLKTKQFLENMMYFYK